MIIKEHKRIAVRARLLSITFYIISLFLVGFYDHQNGGNFGILIVAFGGLAMLSGGAALAWLANPVLWFSWFMVIRKPKLSFIGSLLSTIISLSFLLFDTIRDAGTTVGTDYQVGSFDVKVTGYGLGYWLWVLSSLILLMGNFYVVRKSSKRNREHK